MKRFKSFVNEEVPLNAISAGNIAGVGYPPGSDVGEPGVTPADMKKQKQKHKKSNIMVALIRRMSKGY